MPPPMPDPEFDPRFDGLSGAARRLLDYVAVLEGGARYETLRHIARVSEEDMVEDIREIVNAGLIAPRPGQPNLYDFVDPLVKEHVLSEIGEARLPKLRLRAEGARERVEGGG
jgi:hypothetical protein